MKATIILDFDGTLFNTLPVFYKITKKKLNTFQEIFDCHKNYVRENKPLLLRYSSIWSIFLKKMQENYEIILISETKLRILEFYLSNLKLRFYFQTILGEQVSMSGKRIETIMRILRKKKGLQNIFVSDNKSDLVINFENLLLFPSNDFFSGDVLYFEKHVLNLTQFIEDLKKRNPLNSF